MGQQANSQVYIKYNTQTIVVNIIIKLRNKCWCHHTNPLHVLQFKPLFNRAIYFFSHPADTGLCTGGARVSARTVSEIIKMWYFLLDEIDIWPNSFLIEFLRIAKSATFESEDIIWRIYAPYVVCPQHVALLIMGSVRSEYYSCSLICLKENFLHAWTLEQNRTWYE